MKSHKLLSFVSQVYLSCFKAVYVFNWKARQKYWFGKWFLQYIQRTCWSSTATLLSLNFDQSQTSLRSFMWIPPEVLVCTGAPGKRSVCVWEEKECTVGVPVLDHWPAIALSSVLASSMWIPLIMFNAAAGQQSWLKIPRVRMFSFIFFSWVHLVNRSLGARADLSLSLFLSFSLSHTHTHTQTVPLHSSWAEGFGEEPATSAEADFPRLPQGYLSMIPIGL